MLFAIFALQALESRRGIAPTEVYLKATCSIIPTKDRRELIRQAIERIKTLRGLHRIQPEIIVGDNDSKDQTWQTLQKVARDFPVPLHLLKVSKPGKCTVLNEAVRTATGEILAFLDDDVVVDKGWLEGLENFFQYNDGYSAAQGSIRIP